MENFDCTNEKTDATEPFWITQQNCFSARNSLFWYVIGRENQWYRERDIDSNVAQWTKFM